MQKSARNTQIPLREQQPAWAIWSPRKQAMPDKQHGTMSAFTNYNLYVPGIHTELEASLSGNQGVQRVTLGGGTKHLLSSVGQESGFFKFLVANCSPKL